MRAIQYRETLIDGAGEASIRRIGNQSYAAASDFACRAVRGSIVNHHDFSTSRKHCIQTCADLGFGIVCDNNNADTGHVSLFPTRQKKIQLPVSVETGGLLHLADDLFALSHQSFERSWI